MVDEKTSEEPNIEPDDVSVSDDVTESEKFDTVYTCLRCGTKVNNSELSLLPEIKCICGFKVFIKLRPPIVKSIKAV